MEEAQICEVCYDFEPQAWRKSLCRNCFHSLDEHSEEILAAEGEAMAKEKKSGEDKKPNSSKAKGTEAVNTKYVETKDSKTKATKEGSSKSASSTSSSPSSSSSSASTSSSSKTSLSTSAAVSKGKAQTNTSTSSTLASAKPSSQSTSPNSKTPSLKTSTTTTKTSSSPSSSSSSVPSLKSASLATHTTMGKNAETPSSISAPSASTSISGHGQSKAKSLTEKFEKKPLENKESKSNSKSLPSKVGSLKPKSTEPAVNDKSIGIEKSGKKDKSDMSSNSKTLKDGKESSAPVGRTKNTAPFGKGTLKSTKDDNKNTSVNEGIIKESSKSSISDKNASIKDISDKTKATVDTKIGTEESSASQQKLIGGKVGQLKTQQKNLDTNKIGKLSGSVHEDSRSSAREIDKDKNQPGTLSAGAGQGANNTQRAGTGKSISGKVQAEQKPAISTTGNVEEKRNNQKQQQQKTTGRKSEGEDIAGSSVSKSQPTAKGKFQTNQNYIGEQAQNEGPSEADSRNLVRNTNSNISKNVITSASSNGSSAKGGINVDISQKETDIGLKKTTDVSSTTSQASKTSALNSSSTSSSLTTSGIITTAASSLPLSSTSSLKSSSLSSASSKYGEKDSAPKPLVSESSNVDNQTTNKLSGELKLKEEKISDLENQLSTMEKKLKNVEEERERVKRMILKEQKDEMEKSLKGLRSQLSQMEEQCSRLENDNSALKRSMQEHEKTVKRDQDVRGITEENEILQRDLETTEVELDEVKDENTDLKRQVMEMKNEMDEMYDTFRENEHDEFRELQKELDMTAKNCRILQFKLRKAERRNEQIEEDRIHYEDKLRQLQDRFDSADAKNHIRILEEELRMAKEVSVRLHDELDIVEDKKNKAMEDNKHLTELLEHTDKRQFRMEMEIDKLRDLVSYISFFHIIGKWV